MGRSSANHAAVRPVTPLRRTGYISKAVEAPGCADQLRGKWRSAHVATSILHSPASSRLHGFLVGRLAAGNRGRVLDFSKVLCRACNARVTLSHHRHIDASTESEMRRSVRCDAADRPLPGGPGHWNPRSLQRPFPTEPNGIQRSFGRSRNNLIAVANRRERFVELAATSPLMASSWASVMRRVV